MFIVELGGTSHYSVLGVLPTATAEELRQARDWLVQQLRERQRREPENSEDLIGRQKAVNAAAEELLRPARRAKYDEEHSDLKFFTVRVAAAAMFVDPADRMAVLDRAMTAHLMGRGVPIEPMSDLDREDFSADTRRNRLLEELLRGAADRTAG